MARAAMTLNPGNYDFPEPLLPSQQMIKASSWTQLGVGAASKSQGATSRAQSAGRHFARSISPEKSRAFVRSQQRSLPKMVPETIRKDLHRYGMPGDGPMGLKNINAVTRYFEFKGYVEGGENRALTLAQFMQIYAYIEAKCFADWNLNVPAVTFYDVNTWLCQPATKSTSSSLFEHIADRQQAPMWFLSHWWGEPITNVMKCMRKHYSVRQLPQHAAYWICAFANRQHELAVEFGGDPRQANFFKAMQHAKFKVLLVLDISCGPKGPATPFKRMWCVFECAMCLDQVTAPIDAAVIVPGPDGGGVEMVCNGLTKFERTSDTYLPGRGMSGKVKREHTFPDEIVKAGLAFNLKACVASSEDDRRRILNLIIGQPEDAQPPRDHPKYQEINARMQGLFCQVFWHRALAKDQPADKEDRKKFMQHLKHLSNAMAGDTWRKSLSLCLAGCQLSDIESVKLMIQGLPPNVNSLSLNLQNSGIVDEHIVYIAQMLPQTVQVFSLDLSGCPEISDGGVMKFVRALKKTVQTLVLGLQRTQVGEFLLRVAKSEPLDELRDRARAQGITGSMIADPKSESQKSEDRQALLESMLRTKVNSEVRARILVDLAAAGQSADRLEMNRRRDEM